MTEQEYIDVENLANVKTALNSVRQLSVDDAIIKPTELRDVADKLVLWETNLHKKIKINE